MKTPELHALLEQVRKGDADAFAAVYDQLSKPVYTIAYRITRSREQAEDITQETFLRLWHSPPEPDVQNPRAFIFRTVHNLAIDAIRREQPVELPETLPDPTDTAGQISLQATLSAAMDCLTPEERGAVSLHIYGELTFQEIAQSCGRSLPAVYRCYRRGLKKLRAVLEKGEFL